MDTAYSLSDIASVLGNKDGMFGGSGIWFFAFIILLLIGNGGLFGGNRYADSALNTFATASSQNEILLGQKFDALGQKVNSIGDGLCSSTYALNNTILGEGRALQGQVATMACDNQRNIDSVRYDMANFAASINSNIDNKFAALEKNQLNQTIQNQAQQINQLYMAQQLCGVVRWPNSLAFNAGPSPFCGCNNCGCGNM